MSFVIKNMMIGGQQFEIESMMWCFVKCTTVTQTSLNWPQSQKFEDNNFSVCYWNFGILKRQGFCVPLIYAEEVARSSFLSRTLIWLSLTLHTLSLSPTRIWHLNNNIILYHGSKEGEISCPGEYWYSCAAVGAADSMRTGRNIRCSQILNSSSVSSLLSLYSWCPCWTTMNIIRIS